MSTATSAQDIFPAGLTLAGGIPIKSQDLAASIIFAIAYFLLLPVAVLRLARPSSRCLPLLRPVLFVLIRIVTFILRAVMGEGNYGTGLFVAQQILLLCGFILLCEPLMSLIGYHIVRNNQPSANRRNTLERVVIALQIALYAALILGIYAGSQYGSISGNSKTLNTVKDCRDANAIIACAITALATAITLLAWAKERLPFVPSLQLVVMGSLLTLASGYKIVLYLGPAVSPLHAGTKAAFYTLNSLPEFLAAVLYFVTNLNEQFAISETKEKARISKLMREGKWNPTGAGPYTESKYGSGDRMVSNAV